MGRADFLPEAVCVLSTGRSSWKCRMATQRAALGVSQHAFCGGSLHTHATADSRGVATLSWALPADRRGGTRLHLRSSHGGDMLAGTQPQSPHAAASWCLLFSRW